MFYVTWTDAHYKVIRNEKIECHDPDGKTALIKRLGSQYLKEVQRSNSDSLRLIITDCAAVVAGDQGFAGAVSIEEYRGEVSARILEWLAGDDDEG